MGLRGSLSPLELVALATRAAAKVAGLSPDVKGVRSLALDFSELAAALLD